MGRNGGDLHHHQVLIDLKQRRNTVITYADLCKEYTVTRQTMRSKIKKLQAENEPIFPIVDHYHGGGLVYLHCATCDPEVMALVLDSIEWIKHSGDAVRRLERLHISAERRQRVFYLPKKRRRQFRFPGPPE